jgi:tetratricopeptide (TPR) repeat protein
MKVASKSRRKTSIKLLGILILWVVWASADQFVTAKGTPDKKAPTPQSERMTLEQFKQLQQEETEAANAPRGDERIARCEEFLREHPDYPGRGGMMLALAEAYFDKGTFDPAYVASLIEKSANAEQFYGRLDPTRLVSRYYFSHSLPMDSAQRLVNKSRGMLAAERKALAAEKDPNRRQDLQTHINQIEFQIPLTEGRILLARKNYPAALTALREAESLGKRTGLAGLLLLDDRDQMVGSLPPGHNSSDWLYLSLAMASARTGDPAGARRYLERVRGFLGPGTPELAEAVESFRKEMNLPPPSRKEVRAEPVLASDFSLKDLEGQNVSLAQFRDRVVMVMFWASW